MRAVRVKQNCKVGGSKTKIELKEAKMLNITKQNC